MPPAMRARALSMSARVAARRANSLPGLVLQPVADDAFHADSPGHKAARLVERFGVVGEQIEVLAGEAEAEQLEHAPADAAPAIRRMRPHVDEVRVAYTVRYDAPGADDGTAVAGKHAAEAGTEGALHLSRRSSVVEIVRGEIRLERGPVDALGRRRVFDDHQNGNSRPGSEAWRTRRNSPWIRFSAVSLSASKRNTITGVVFDARASPKPSAYSTRRPSMRMTLAAPGNSQVSAMAAMSWCADASLHATLSSGVLMLSGRDESSDDASAWRETISSNRAPAYRPSSKPYQRSLKKVWPLISPASSAPVCFIFDLISECPVFHISGVPPWRRIQGCRLRVDFTS